jgi:hypothetical protein
MAAENKETKPTEPQTETKAEAPTTTPTPPNPKPTSKNSSNPKRGAHKTTLQDSNIYKQTMKTSKNALTEKPSKSASTAANVL